MAITISGSGITSANIADGTITTDDILASDVVSLKSGRKNLIINGGMDVSQRGDYSTATTLTNGTYYLDRFKTVLGGTATYTHKSNQLVDGKYVNTLLMTLTSTGYAATQQFVEDFAKLKGRAVTLSMWVKSNKAGANIGIYDGISQTNSSGHTGGGSWEKLTVSHTCSTSTNQMRTEVWTGTGSSIGSYIEFTGVQLEVGSVATDFEHRSYGEELALCQRYYYHHASGASSFIGIGTFVSATQMRTLVYFPVTMRTDPTLTQVTGTNYFQIEYGAQDAFDLFTGLITNNINGAALYTSGMTSTTAGYSGVVRGLDASSLLAFDAEL